MGSYAPSPDSTPFLRDPRSGDHLRTSLNSTGAATLSIDGHCYFTFLDIPSPVTIQDVQIDVLNTPGGVGSVIRAGLYRDNGDGTLPSRLIADLGTQDGTTTGTKTFPANIAVPASRLWIACVSQGASAPAPTLRMDTTFSGPQLTPFAVGANIANLYPRTIAVFGALPDPFGTNSPTNFGIAALVNIA